MRINPNCSLKLKIIEDKEVKKLLAFILVTLSCILCLPGCTLNGSNNYSIEDEELVWEETLLDKKYLVSDDIVFRLLLNYDEDVYKKVTYSINNSEEKEVSVITDKVIETRQDLGKKYYVDTGAEIIDAEALGAGAYLIIFYAYNDDGERIQVNDDPIVFQIKSE